MYFRVLRLKTERVYHFLSILLSSLIFSHTHTLSFSLSLPLSIINHRHRWLYTLTLSLSLSLSLYNLVNFILFFFSIFFFFLFFPLKLSSVYFNFALSLIVGVCMCVFVCMFYTVLFRRYLKYCIVTDSLHATIIIWFFCTYRRISLCSNGNIHRRRTNTHMYARTHTDIYICMYIYIYIYISLIFIIYTHDLDSGRRALSLHFCTLLSFPCSLIRRNETISFSGKLLRATCFFFFCFIFVTRASVHRQSEVIKKLCTSRVERIRSLTFHGAFCAIASSSGTRSRRVFYIFRRASEEKDRRKERRTGKNPSLVEARRPPMEQHSDRSKLCVCL